MVSQVVMSWTTTKESRFVVTQVLMAWTTTKGPGFEPPLEIGLYVFYDYLFIHDPVESSLEGPSSRCCESFKNGLALLPEAKQTGIEPGSSCFTSDHSNH